MLAQQGRHGLGRVAGQFRAGVSVREPDAGPDALELFQGPLIAPNRATALAGAMTGAAQAVEGVYNNAAAPAVREPFSLSFVNIDPSIGFSLPGAYGGTDFDNRGEQGNSANAQRTNRFLSYNAGLEVQVGPVGVTVMGDFLNYTVGSAQGTPVSLTLGRIHAVAAYAFADNQVVIGAGARITFVNVQEQGQQGALVRMLGAAPQIGVIVKPNDVRWRIGTTARAAVNASPFALGTSDNPSSGVQQAGPFVLPKTITQPWELEAGIAYQLGPRPLNPVWIDPHGEERALDERLGLPLNVGLHDYKIPTMADMPVIDGWFLDGADPQANHVGVRGIAEPAIIPTAAAIAGAVADAIGVDVLELPLTPWRILAALEQR